MAMRDAGRRLDRRSRFLVKWLAPVVLLVASSGVAVPPASALERSVAVAVPLADDHPYFLGGANGELYFKLRSELWRTDGTPAGTILLSPAEPLEPHHDLVPGCSPFCPKHFPQGGSANGLFFLAADDGVHGSELWRSDGTPAGTFMVHDGDTTPFDPPNFVPVNELVFFTRGHLACPPQCELWRSDGTLPGTLALTSVPAHLSLVGAGVNGLLLFQNGPDIWSSDGTVSGTGALVTGAEFLAVSGGTLFFTSSTGLWARAGTGAVQLTDFPVLLHGCVSGACYFSNSTSGLQGIWKSDGTPGGTLELAPMTLSFPIPGFVDVNGTVYFQIIDELWKTNGTVAGTLLVADGVAPWHPLVSAYGQLFFISSDQLWKTDGTTAGTVLVKNFGADQALTGIFVVNEKLWLRVYGPCPLLQCSVVDWHLYSSDGTAPGTQLVADLAQFVRFCPTPLCVAGDLTPPNSTVTGGKWFFEALDPVSHSPRLWVATHVFFRDVAPDHWAFALVERLAEAGITAGCNLERYCPDDPVTRAQMAVLLERAKNGPGFIPPPGTGAIFADVPSSYWAGDWIEQLHGDGVTSGCGISPLAYCPEDAVTRAQMAIFLLRARHGGSYTPPPVGSGTGFSDVPATHWAAAWIVALAAEGITSGCAAGAYCPDDPVTRAQMAVFLARTFGLLPP